VERDGAVVVSGCRSFALACGELWTQGMGEDYSLLSGEGDAWRTSFRKTHAVGIFSNILGSWVTEVGHYE
jgi:hypothetical protein